MVEARGGALVDCNAGGWLARFEDAAAAVSAAAELQRVLLGLDWSPTLLARPEAGEERDKEGMLVQRGCRVAVAVHSGPILEQPGDTVGGPALDQVCRIVAATHGGRVLVSAQAWARVDRELPGLIVEDLGWARLVGVDGSVRLFGVRAASLAPRTFPQPATLDRRGANALALDGLYYGRDSDLSALGELLQMGVRLITLSGPSGSGVTRLARRLALLSRPRYAQAGGAFLCTCTEPGAPGVARAVAEALSVPLDLARTDEECEQQVGYALSARERTLVVVAGAFGDLGSIARCVDRWLGGAPDCALVVDAGGAFDAPREVAYELAPLEAPSPGDARHADACRLFIDRAQGVVPAFRPLDTDVLHEVLRRLGWLPAAIQLAAGLVDRLPLDAIAQALPDHDIADLAWAHLSDRERELLCACAVHEGSLRPRRAVELAALPDPAEAQALLCSLMARGLLEPALLPSLPGLRRYALPEEVRQRALASVTQLEAATLRTRLAEVVLGDCEGWLELADGAGAAEIVAYIAADWPALVGVVRAALEPVPQPAALDLAMRAALALEPVFRTRGPAPEQLRLLDALLQHCDAALGADPVLQARVLALRADRHLACGRTQAAVSDLERAKTIAERWSDAQTLGRCSVSLGEVWLRRGGFVQARSVFEQAASAYRAAGAPRAEADARRRLAVTFMELGDIGEAERLLTDALEVVRAAGAVCTEAVCLGSLGLLCRRVGRPDDARRHYRAAVAIQRETGMTRLEGVMLGNLAILDYHAGMPAEAERLCLQAVERARATGDRDGEGACLRRLALVHLDAGRPDDARRALLQALAVHRESGLERVEGATACTLGMVQHVIGSLEAARDYYARGLALVVDARQQVLFTAWRGALEAELLDRGTAAAHITLAEHRLAGLEDDALGRVVEVLRLLVRAVCAVGPERPEALEEARVRRAELAAEAHRDGGLRLALRRLEAVLAEEALGG